MGNIFVTSDTHFGHNRDFLYGPRGFNSADEMNEAIITLWNETVRPEDDVYLLGDVMLNDNERGIKCLKALKGNIHIALGNHDTESRIALYNKCWNVVEIEYAYRLKVRNWRFYLTHYPTLVGNYDDDKAPTRQLYNICGHTHTQNAWADWPLGRIFHCEMDTNHCVPWNIEEIIDLLRERT